MTNFKLYMVILICIGLFGFNQSKQINNKQLNPDNNDSIIYISISYVLFGTNFSNDTVVLNFSNNQCFIENYFASGIEYCSYNLFRRRDNLSMSFHFTVPVQQNSFTIKQSNPASIAIYNDSLKPQIQNQIESGIIAIDTINLKSGYCKGRFKGKLDMSGGKIDSITGFFNVECNNIYRFYN